MQPGASPRRSHGSTTPPRRSPPTAAPRRCPRRRSPRSSPTRLRAAPVCSAHGIASVPPSVPDPVKRLLLVLVVACQPPGAGTPTTRPAPPPHVYLLTDLVGGWRWQLRTSEAGTTRIETETWRFRPAIGVPTQLSGRYLRDVEVRSDDRVPFACNQRPWYRQRALYDVTVEATRAAFEVRETDYQTEPSPCDHGFRHLGAYTGELTGNRFALSWDGGSQTLWQTDAELEDLPGSTWPSPPHVAGPWREGHT